jgi:predicted amidohydrolase
VSLRDQILAAKDRINKTVEVPEWGVTIELRTMTAAQRVTMFSEAYDPNNGQTNLKVLYPQVILSCCFDPKSGEAIFTSEDVDAVMDKSGVVIERIALEALNLSGIDKDAVTDAGKALLGNQSDDSPMN